MTCKVKDGNKEDRPATAVTQRGTITNWTNFWYSEDNSMKFCVEGALANWLFHLGATKEANEFKHLVTMETQNLKDQMKVEKLPKKVQRKNGSLNPITKCLWILREKFNCKTTARLNCDYFRCGMSAFTNLSKIRCPVLVSLVSTNSHYKHVIVIWQSRIIDFEHKSTYPLSTENLNFACGCGSTFTKIDFGCGLAPTTDMRKLYGKIDGKWGHEDLCVGGELSDLIMKRNTGGN